MDPKTTENNHISWVRQSQRLLDSLNVAYLLTDMNNVILEVNDTLLRLTDLKREDYIGMRLNDYFPESDLESLRFFDKRAGKFDEIEPFFQYEFFVRGPEGEIVPCLSSISVNYDEDGKPVTFNNLVSNISELKKAEAALENEKKLLEAVLFGIGDCVTVFSVDGDVLIESPKGMTIRGRRKRPLLELFPGNEKKLDIKVGKKLRSYDARIEAVHDDKSNIFAYIETLTDTTDRIQLERQTRELDRIRRAMQRSEIEAKMVGDSQAIQNVFDLILKCAEVDANVLILGETGVGKELAARSIHNMSQRKGHPFVAVNCGALPDALLESELFGHVKGAFTGAVSDRLGLFREAAGGTLFLDEIGDISPQMQVKLLRALQEKEIRPLGDSAKYTVDARVITATNKDLARLMDQEEFRSDLYYRIAVIPIIIPPLRERMDDILLLARHFMKKYRKSADSPPKNLSHKAQELLMRYGWPGNIRELENAIEYALAMSRSDTLRSTDFSFHLHAGKKSNNLKKEIGKPLVEHPAGENFDKKQNLEETPQNISLAKLMLEKEKILKALNDFHGRRDLVADALGISRVSLWRKMKKYGLSGWKFKDNLK